MFLKNPKTINLMQFFFLSFGKISEKKLMNRFGKNYLPMLYLGHHKNFPKIQYKHFYSLINLTHLVQL